MRIKVSYGVSHYCVVQLKSLVVPCSVFNSLVVICSVFGPLSSLALFNRTALLVCLCVVLCLGKFRIFNFVIVIAAENKSNLIDCYEQVTVTAVPVYNIL